MILLSIAYLLVQYPVQSIDDLNDPIRYLDRERAYFIGVDGESFRIGRALDSNTNPYADVPQSAGLLGKCSTKEFDCKSVGLLRFIVPKGRWRSVSYDDGMKVTIETVGADMIQASGVCEGVTARGCVHRPGRRGPTLTYQYTFSRAVGLQTISVQHWKDNVIVDREDMVLVDKQGLRVDQ